MRGKKRLPPTEWESEAAAPETSSSAATAATATATAVAKRPKVPALTGVIVEALKMDGLQRLCSTLEPLLRRIVSEEVERALTELSCAKLNGSSSSPLRIDGPVGRKLQLHFRSRMHPHLFTGGKVEGEQGAAIHVVLLDANTGMVVSSGPESMAKLNVMVLEGDFNDEADDDWSQERFESYEVKEREGKRPLLTGHLQVTLKGGVGTLGELIFTDNSSWTRSRKFRLGLKLADGCCDGIRIREAKTEAFAVKDHRGELYKKHYPPALHDEVWRLERIAKDGALHKKLVSANIQTVEDFLRFLVRDPRRLRNILGSAVSNKMWENTVEHAKTCVLSEKVYVYYDETRSTGAVFNHIYELRGLISNGQFLSVESLSHDQKVSVDLLVKRAYDDWSHAIEYDGHDLLNSEKSSQKAQHAATTDCISPLGHCFMPTAQPEGCYSSSTGTRLQNEGAHSNRSGLMVLATPQTSYGSACASGDWPHVQQEQNFDHFKEQIRIRSSEILEHGDMQCLLSSFNTGGVGGFATSSEAHYSYPNAHFEPQSECMFGQEHNRNNAKAAISWLKLKAAFRWGIFIRKKAAERRAQLVELD